MVIMFDRIIVSTMCGEHFKNFLYPTCVNCRGVSAVVSRYRLFLLFSISCGVLISDKQSGFEKW